MARWRYYKKTRLTYLGFYHVVLPGFIYRGQHRVSPRSWRWNTFAASLPHIATWYQDPDLSFPFGVWVTYTGRSDLWRKTFWPTKLCLPQFTTWFWHFDNEKIHETPRIRIPHLFIFLGTYVAQTPFVSAMLIWKNTFGVQGYVCFRWLFSSQKFGYIL